MRTFEYLLNAGSYGAGEDEHCAELGQKQGPNFSSSTIVICYPLCDIVFQTLMPNFLLVIARVNEDDEGFLTYSDAE